MIEINLIPDVKQEFLKAQKLRNATISISILAGLGAIAITAVLALLLGAQLIHENIQKDAVKSEFAKLQKVSDVNDLLTIQSQLAALPVLQKNKSMTSRVFDTIVAITPNDQNQIKISNLQIDPESNTMTIEGSTVSGFTATDVFRKTILNTKVTYRSGDEDTTVPLTEEVMMGPTSYGEDSTGARVLRFKLSFEYPSELLTNAGTSVRVQSPTGQVDVTDSKTRVPDSLFSQQAQSIEGGN
jgi:hypothetical protein